MLLPPELGRSALAALAFTVAALAQPAAAGSPSPPPPLPRRLHRLWPVATVALTPHPLTARALTLAALIFSFSLALFLPLCLSLTGVVAAVCYTLIKM